MNKRPDLSKRLDSNTFREFYYLKEELVDFCRRYGLPTTGGKIEITNRIAYFLDTGVITPKSVGRKKVINGIDEIFENTKIEKNFVCSEKHRAFFKNRIGKNFSFIVPFQKWLKNNEGKTYQDAIDAYYRILEEKKNKGTMIDKQFEYNNYIRNFFLNNKGRSLDEAIKCWKYKKSLPGSNNYEASDLKAIKNTN